MSEDYVILVVGSKKWIDYKAVEMVLIYEIDKAFALGEVNNKKNIVIRHGGCPTGVDHIANDIAKRWNLRTDVMKADWRVYGGSAGTRRNQQMIDKGINKCLAFTLPESKFAHDCIKRVKKAGLPYREIAAEEIGKD